MKKLELKYVFNIEKFYLNNKTLLFKDIKIYYKIFTERNVYSINYTYNCLSE